MATSWCVCCSILDELAEADSPFWRPVVLPAPGDEAQTALKQFRDGERNVLITKAGNDLTAGVPPCSLIVRSGPHNACDCVDGDCVDDDCVDADCVDADCIDGEV